MGSSNTLPISAVSLLRFPYTQFQKVSFEDGLLRSKCRLLWSGNLLHRGKEVLPKQDCCTNKVDYNCQGEQDCCNQANCCEQKKCTGCACCGNSANCCSSI